MKTLYILQLADNKWYVGTTNRPLEERVFDTAWTRRYAPIAIEKTIDDVDDFEEDRQTKIYMRRHGIANVRGGSYCDVILSFDQLKELELCTANNMCNCEGHHSVDCDEYTFVRCFRCGRFGHLAEECHVTTAHDGGLPRNAVCYRCGSADHWRWKCTETHDIFGRELSGGCSLQ